MPDYSLVDTTVLAHLTKVSPHSEAYNRILGDDRIAISFQTQAELSSGGYKGARKQRLDDLLAATLKLPQSEATNIWYGRVIQKRKELRTLRKNGADAGDADVWIISSALEHGLRLLSHDRQQVGLARAMAVPTFTDLVDLRDGNTN